MIGSWALKARVEENLGVALAPGFFDKAEQYARRKLDLCNERAGRQYGEDGYAAPIVHGHDASQIEETTGETVEAAQRRQDFDISAIQEQLDTGFTGTTVTHTFAPAQIDQWKGYDGDGIPEGILDTVENRLYL